MALAPGHLPLEVRAASLFDVDPELGEALGDGHLAEARLRAVVATLELPSGRWDPAAVGEMTSRPFALLVVDGLVVREILLAGSTATELLGPGDLVDFRATNDALLPTITSWSVPDAARLAIVDDRVLPMLRTWPVVGRILLERAAHRSGRLAVHRAIAQLPRVDQRLLAYFAHLSERWGRVSSAGIVVPLQFTHETLGRLIGARRPTVSLALKELCARGLLERRADGAWLLRYEAFDTLATERAAAERRQPADARPLPDGEADAPDPLPRPAAFGFRAVDVEALAARVEHLQAEHAARIAHCMRVIDGVQATRRARERDRASR